MRTFNKVMLGLGLWSGISMADTVFNEPSKGFMSLGIQGGASFANATSTSDISSSARTGFILGMNADVRITSALSFSPELMYVQKGSNIVDTSGVRVVASYDSLELPLLMKVSLGAIARPYLFAGPVAILNFSNRVEVQAGSASGNFTFEPRAVDFAADIGAGLEIGTFFANLRYSLGLLDIDTKHVDWRSRGIQLLVGMRLGS